MLDVSAGRHRALQFLMLKTASRILLFSLWEQTGGTCGPSGPRYTEIRLTPSFVSRVIQDAGVLGFCQGKGYSLFLWMAGDWMIISGRCVIESFFFLKVTLQKGDQGTAGVGDEEGEDAGKRTHKSHKRM